MSGFEIVFGQAQGEVEPFKINNQLSRIEQIWDCHQVIISLFDVTQQSFSRENKPNESMAKDVW